MRNRLYAFALSIFALIVITAPAHASVVIEGTRLIYPAAEREVSVKLNNAGDKPSLVQVWFDSGDMATTPKTATAPFIVTPPIFRMDGGKSQTLRVMYTQEALPAQQESIFWLNVLDIPPAAKNAKAADASYLQLALRTRIKVFFRPEGLTGSANEAADHIVWQIVASKSSFVLRATNSSAFHVSLGGAEIVVNGKKYEANTSMLLPNSTADFPINDLHQLLTIATLNYTTLNDYGTVIEHNDLSIAMKSESK